MRGGARFLRNKKNEKLGTKNRAAGEIFFYLKDSKRVKINDQRLKNYIFKF